jgi:dynein heavy chain
MFEALDREFRDMMADASINPLVVESCTAEKNEVLKAQSATIKRCEKSLNEYLEQKKKSFPRFYFLSNQSLLTILSNGTNPPKVCEFIGDCFDGMKSLIFLPPKSAGEVAKQANGMTSKDDEQVPFQSEDFVCDGAVENWLSKLEGKMRLTLYEVLEQSKATSEFWDNPEYKPRDDWCADYPAQCALLTT